MHPAWIALLGALAANGAEPLEIGLEVTSREVRFTLRNTSSSAILVPLGMTVRESHATLPQLKIETSGARQWRVLYTGIGAVGGYAAPYTIGLLAQETYTVAVPIFRYIVSEPGRTWKLEEFLLRRCRLWVEFDVTREMCPNPATLDGLRRKLPCWYGRARSNALEFPRARPVQRGAATSPL